MCLFSIIICTFAHDLINNKEKKVKVYAERLLGNRYVMTDVDENTIGYLFASSKCDDVNVLQMCNCVST